MKLSVISDQKFHVSSDVKVEATPEVKLEVKLEVILGVKLKVKTEVISGMKLARFIDLHFPLKDWRQWWGAPVGNVLQIPFDSASFHLKPVRLPVV